jgi:prepilin-type N-terminal cleavage/methylation domain-containing protein
MKGARSGFTLLEMLVVIAILGILGALVANTMTGFRQTQRVREAQSQIVQAIERVRQHTRRYNIQYRITFDNTNRKYSAVARDIKGTELTDLPKIEGQLPQGIVYSSLPSTTIDFTGPFGRVDATSKCFEVQLEGTTKFGEIGIYGVTGRPVSRPIRDGGTTSC